MNILTLIMEYKLCRFYYFDMYFFLKANGVIYGMAIAEEQRLLQDLFGGASELRKSSRPVRCVE